MERGKGGVDGCAGGVRGVVLSLSFPRWLTHRSTKFIRPCTGCAHSSLCLYTHCLLVWQQPPRHCRQSTQFNMYYARGGTVLLSHTLCFAGSSFPHQIASTHNVLGLCVRSFCVEVSQLLLMQAAWDEHHRAWQAKHRRLKVVHPVCTIWEEQGVYIAPPSQTIHNLPCHTNAYP